MAESVLAKCNGSIIVTQLVWGISFVELLGSPLRCQAEGRHPDLTEMVGFVLLQFDLEPKSADHPNGPPPARA